MSNYPQITENGHQITMNGNNRITLLSSQSTQNPQKSDFAFFNLNTISFDIDVSTATCGCNAGLYFVDLHAAPDHAPHYCDANKIQGTWCPENDIIEANSHGMHVTPHCCCQNGCNGTPGEACLSNVQSSYNTCDQWGYAGGFGGSHVESFDRKDPYGPGKYIDTTKPYHFVQQYQDKEIITTLSQDGKTIKMNHSKYQSYLQKFKPFIGNGMSLVITLWGGNMSWLDGGEGGCTNEQCSLNNVYVKISNIFINGEQITFQQKSDEKQTE